MNEQKAETREKVYKEIKTQLYEPFYNLLKEYLAFSGADLSLDVFCRQIIYQYTRQLYLQIRDLAAKQPLDLRESWFHKWTDIAITIDEGEDDE